jgi:xylulokinase
VIADVFEAEVVPVEGEGAALGAALHAAWVWLKEKGESVSISDVVSRFVTLDERRRRQPDPANQDIYRYQKRLYEALSRRVRGLEGEDPFRLRAEMIQ